MKKIIYIIICTFILSGCAVSKCLEPDVKLPESLTSDMVADSLCIADLSWMEVIGDTLLTNLINNALEYNKDLLSAGARIREYEKLYRVNKSAFFPTIEASAYADRETNKKSGSNSVKDVEIAAKLSLSWEADFFGRIRWSSKEALANYMKTIEARRSLQMTLIADVATSYFELLALDKELKIVQSTIAIREENVKQAKLRFEAGLISEIPYQQTQVELAKTAAMLPDLNKRIKIKENEICFLTGSLPSGVKRASIDSKLVAKDTLFVGVPSDVLKRRPDIKEAEYALKAAMSKVGYNWADRFPRFVIGFDWGLENNGFKGFLKAPLTYMIGELSSPIFSFGQKRAKYKAALEAYDAVRLNYEEKVLQAFKEVDDAIASYVAAKQNTELMLSLKSSSYKYVQLARIQYLNGQINYIDVLDAQRSYFNAEIDHSNAVRDQYLALIDMYKALGGGGF